MTAPTLNLTSTPAVIAQRLVPGSLQISESLQRRSICTFRLLLEPDLATWPGLSIGQPVTLSDGTDLLFAGTVDSDDSDELVVGEGLLEQPVTCVDYSQILDRFLVAADYQNMSAGAVVRDILTNPASCAIAGEVGPGRRLSVGQIDDGPDISIILNYRPVRGTFDEISELTGLTWILQPSGAIDFRARSAGTDRTVDFAGLRVSRNRGRRELRTRQFVRGGQGISGDRVETFSGDGVQRSFSLALPVGAVPTAIKVGDDVQTVGIRGVDTGQQWYWSKGDTEISQDSAGTPLRSNQTLEVTYKYEYPILTVINDVDKQVDRSAVEGGTGIYEVIEADDRVGSPALALERGRSLLRRFGQPEEHLTVTADDARGPAALLAARPGDLINVNNQRLHLDGEFLVETVDTRDLDGLHLERTWELSGGEAYGGWTAFFQRLAAERTGELTIREGEGVQLARSTPDDRVTFTETISSSTESAVIARVGSARVGFFEVQ